MIVSSGSIVRGDLVLTGTCSTCGGEVARLVEGESSRNVAVVKIEFGRWQFTAEPEATRSAYEQLPNGSPERCGCLYCRNFAAARGQVYPEEALQLLHQLGIPPDREAETYEGGPSGNGLYSYGGWFHFVGTDLLGKDAFVRTHESGGIFDLHKVTPTFAVGLTTELALVAEPFRLLPVLQLEFQAEVPLGFGGASSCVAR